MKTRQTLKCSLSTKKSNPDKHGRSEDIERLTTVGFGVTILSQFSHVAHMVPC